MKKLSQLFAFGCLLIMVNSSAQNSQSTKNVKLNILHIDAHLFPKVLVSFKADNQNGIPFWDLSNNKIIITDEGKNCTSLNLKQTISSKPIYLSIVVDHSGSMDEDHAQLYDKDGKPLFTIDKDDNMVVPDDYISPIDNAKNSIKQFASSFDTRKDFISITGFGTSVDKSLSLTHNENLINQAVENLKAEGKTALYDGMLQGIAQIKNSDGIKVLVVLTDGEDNTSKSKFTDVINLAVKENIPVYIIGLGDVNKTTLNQISEATNGLFFYTRSSTTLQSIYKMISERVQAVYQLEYISSNKNRGKNKRELNLSAALNNYSVTKDKRIYELTETTAASKISPPTKTDAENKINTNIAQENVDRIKKISNPKITFQSFLSNEKDTFWIFGNIIVTVFLATFILIYKKRKQEIPIPVKIA